MRKFVQVSISGKLPRRDVSLYAGGGKARCVTCESFMRCVGMQKTTDWIMNYEEITTDNEKL